MGNRGGRVNDTVDEQRLFNEAYCGKDDRRAVEREREIVESRHMTLQGGCVAIIISMHEAAVLAAVLEKLKLTTQTANMSRSMADRRGDPFVNKEKKKRSAEIQWTRLARTPHPASTPHRKEKCGAVMLCCNGVEENKQERKNRERR